MSSQAAGGNTAHPGGSADGHGLATADWRPQALGKRARQVVFRTLIHRAALRDAAELPERDMSYHIASMRLLDRQLPVSVAAQKEVAEAGRRLGVHLPRSVREWYSYEDSVAILAEHGNEDPPIEVRDFRLVEWKARRLLPIRNENQGVCVWAVEVDGSDDPGVWVTDGSHHEQRYRLATRFSTYVFTCIWDYRRVLKREAIVQAGNRPLSGAALEFLARRFHEAPRTHGWPGTVQHRFGDESAGILIWASESRADWFIGAESESSLRQVVSTVWPLDEVGRELYGCSLPGKRVLEEIHGKA